MQRPPEAFRMKLVRAELTRAMQTSDEDSAAAAAALKKAKTAMASGEEAEK